jgi:hypothetical protein
MLNLLLFVALQFGDLATTLWFLSRGVEEGNPLVAALIRVSTHPAISLALLKAAACCLAYLAWRRNRLRLLRRINLMFLICVGWNLLAVSRAIG